ncbi:MAG TPA: ABC transporter ATP-binding protein [Candidatus Sulfomarinibacteraceae bacterium]|nr:ABC transporter ATP-binding protein [Candidatus Sulfomarinibacteraceae bacterium]
MIHFKDVTYRYPRADEPVFSELNLDIPKGQFCAVLGANGEGKSTLCYMISGFIPHFYRGELSGTIQVAGNNVQDTPLADLSGQVGLVFANPFNQITGAKFTVRDEIAFGLENTGVPRDEMEQRIERTVAVTGLEGLEDRSPFALSGGQQQRLAIASVLAMQPDVLVLDEPTAQLDPDGARDVYDLLRRLTQSEETTVVLAGHRVELVAQFAERALILAQGGIAADGAPRELLADGDLHTYGVGLTRYTLVARRAQQQGLVDGAQPLPVTMEQAIRFFQ